MVNKDVIHSEPLVQYVLLWKIYWKNSKIYHIKWCRILKHHSVLNKYCVTSKWPNTNHYKKNTCFATFAQKISSWQNAIQSKHVLKLQFLQVLVKHSGGVVLHQKTEKKKTSNPSCQWSMAWVWPPPRMPMTTRMTLHFQVRGSRVPKPSLGSTPRSMPFPWPKSKRTLHGIQNPKRKTNQKNYPPWN